MILMPDLFSFAYVPNWYSQLDMLAEMSLPEKQRKVLLFDFWYAWTDGEIAARMEVTTRTVYNLWQRAFKAIRTFYGRKRSEP